MSKEEQNLDTEKNTLYEVAFHVIPTVGDDGASQSATNLKNNIEKNQGKIVADSAPAMVGLQYQMEKSIDSKKQKHTTAYFAWVKFEMMPENVETLKEDIDGDNNILRYMIVKADKETTLSAEEVSNLISGKKEKEEFKEDQEEDIDENDSESEEETSEEEVDKAIDDLVEEK